MNFLLHEALDILSRPRNILKIPNILLVILSFIICKFTKINLVMGYPFMMMVEPTNICNLRCPLCITGSKLMTRPDGMMDIAKFKQLLDETGKYLVHLTLWSQGEPFVNRHFIEMIACAKAKGIKTLTSTNGHFLIENAEAIVASGLDTLIVAVDGASQDTYEKYRVNGNFEKVHRGILAVSEAKKKMKSRSPEIELQFIVMKHNEHEVDSIRGVAQDCGVQVLSFKTAQVYTQEQAETFLPVNEKYRRYELTEKGLRTKAREINFCRWVLLCPVINWDGTVSPCCFDKNAEYGLGNVFNGGGMKTIWKSEAYAKFRHQIFTQKRKEIPICRNCSEGLEVDVFEKEKIVA